MSQITHLPLLAALVAVGISLHLATTPRPPGRRAWTIPAAFSAVFLALSLQAGLSEGPVGFWTEHTRNLWGNQIWYDLLLGVAAALAFMMPRARRQGMALVPWTLLTFATGSIGLYAFIARLLFLEARSSQT